MDGRRLERLPSLEHGLEKLLLQQVPGEDVGDAHHSGTLDRRRQDGIQILAREARLQRDGADLAAALVFPIAEYRAPMRAICQAVVAAPALGLAGPPSPSPAPCPGRRAPARLR